jgi:hypothetical protein
MAVKGKIGAGVLAAASLWTVVDSNILGALGIEPDPLMTEQAMAFTTSAQALDVMSNTMSGADPVAHPILDDNQAALNGFFELDDGSGKKSA